MLDARTEVGWRRATRHSVLDFNGCAPRVCDRRRPRSFTSLAELQPSSSPPYQTPLSPMSPARMNIPTQPLEDCKIPANDHRCHQPRKVSIGHASQRTGAEGLPVDTGPGRGAQLPARMADGRPGRGHRPGGAARATGHRLRGVGRIAAGAWAVRHHDPADCVRNHGAIADPGACSRLRDRPRGGSDHHPACWIGHIRTRGVGGRGGHHGGRYLPGGWNSRVWVRHRTFLQTRSHRLPDRDRSQRHRQPDAANAWIISLRRWSLRKPGTPRP